MLLSTAIPIVIDAIVIVIISSGNFNKPIIPKIDIAAMKFGIIPISDKVKDLNKIINIIAIPNITKTSVLICESKRLCNILLYKTKTPEIWN